MFESETPKCLNQRRRNDNIHNICVLEGVREGGNLRENCAETLVFLGHSMTIKFGNFATFIVRNYVVIWEAPIEQRERNPCFCGASFLASACLSPKKRAKKDQGQLRCSAVAWRSPWALSLESRSGTSFVEILVGKPSHGRPRSIIHIHIGGGLSLAIPQGWCGVQNPSSPHIRKQNTKKHIIP